MDTCAGRSKVQPDATRSWTRWRSAGRLLAVEQPEPAPRPPTRRGRVGPDIHGHRVGSKHRPAAAGSDARLRPRHRGTASLDPLARNIDELRTLVPVARPHSPPGRIEPAIGKCRRPTCPSRPYQMTCTGSPSLLLAPSAVTRGIAAAQAVAMMIRSNGSLTSG